MTAHIWNAPRKSPVVRGVLIEEALCRAKSICFFNSMTHSADTYQRLRQVMIELGRLSTDERILLENEFHYAVLRDRTHIDRKMP